jgi:hypothetical protein
MKKLLKKLSILISLSIFGGCSNPSFAQVQISIGAGYNFNQHPIYSLNAGYEKERITINGGFQRSLTRATSSTIIAGGEIGYNLLSAGDSYLLAQSIIVSGGYWHVSGNSDQKIIKASWLPSVSLRYIKMFTENGGLFGNAMYLKNNISLQAGMLIKFN